MNKTKYNQLREAITLAVPDILELKKGCVINEDPARSDWSVIVGIDKKEIYIQSCINESYIWHITRDEFKERYKIIIGRDIQLEDCLIVLQKFGKGIVFGGASNSFYSKIGNKIKWLDIHWKPNKHLQDQSDECKELLWDLICKK